MLLCKLFILLNFKHACGSYYTCNSVYNTKEAQGASEMIDLAHLKEMAVANEVDISQVKLIHIISEIEALRTQNAKLVEMLSAVKTLALE